MALSEEQNKIELELIRRYEARLDEDGNDPDLDDDWYETEHDFIPCVHCDGHDACHDFGCALEHGILVDPF